MRPYRLRASCPPSRSLCAPIVILSLLTACSFLVHARHSRRPALGFDALSLLKRADSECNEVHSVQDQCAFVRRYCIDADAGLLPYLEFYYCTLQHTRPVAFVLLVVWLGLLFTTIGIAASDFFSVNLNTIAAILGLSQSLAGVTFLALGNGSPDVFSTFAAMSSNSPSMAVGELIGAASFITGVVAGSMALVREFRVDRATYTRDICFFIVAVGFTMAFLADGQLRFWECWTMIGYYVVYVFTVVGCHWYGVRKKRRLRREGEARSHFFGARGQSGDELAGEPYRDDPGDVDHGPGQPPSPVAAGHADALSLEGALRPDLESQTPLITIQGAHDDSDDDHERMAAAEVTRNMRILRTGAKRHNSINPIRPSLVGALEFRSALAQLQRESNLPLSSIAGRSYSENQFGGRARRGTVAVTLDASHAHAHAVPTPEAGLTRRDRALSSGDVPISSAVVSQLPGERYASDLLTPRGPDHDQKEATSHPVGEASAPLSADVAAGHGPAAEGLGIGSTPKLQLHVSSRCSSRSGVSTPHSIFPGYTDSLMLATPNAFPGQGQFVFPPTPSNRRDDVFPDLQVPAPGSSRVRWWPHSVLPPPHALLAKLFPTLQGWGDKTLWDRFLSTISVPSIFLLVITLPVVDSEPSEDASPIDIPVIDDLSQGGAGGTRQTTAVASPEAETQNEWQGCLNSGPGADGAARVAAREHWATASPMDRATLEAALNPAKATSDLPSGSNGNSEAPPWNRWLVCLQLFTGPLFATLMLWANLREDWERPGRELVRMVLYSLVASLVLLAVLLLTTTEHARPRFYYLLCFMGFVISIAWISTIAGEVVGVLKAFGVILGISEALLGLTVFAAGNSIGDLVADITVARLGYPVMAL